MSKKYFSASQEIAEFHNKALKFASFVTIEVGEGYRKSYGNPVTNGALYSIATESIGLHKVVYTLCLNGWAFATPLILRALLDLYASILVIVNAKKNETDYMAFRYSHWFLKANLNDPTMNKDSKEQIMEGIKKLPKGIQSKAHDFMFKEKMRGYWYSPEYPNAKDILWKFESPLENDSYDKLSSASHGGLLGLNLFRDTPDVKHPNPRADKKSQNLSLMMSNRLMLEMFGIYGHFMNGDSDTIYIDLNKEFGLLRPVVDAQIEKINKT